MLRHLGGADGAAYLPRLQIILGAVVRTTVAPGLELELKHAVFDFWSTFASAVALPPGSNVRKKSRPKRAKDKNPDRHHHHQQQQPGGQGGASAAGSQSPQGGSPSGHTVPGHPAGSALRKILSQACSAVLCATMFPIAGPIASRIGFMDAMVLDDVDEFRRLRQLASSAIGALMTTLALDVGSLNYVCSGMYARARTNSTLTSQFFASARDWLRSRWLKVCKVVVG